MTALQYDPFSSFECFFPVTMNVTDLRIGHTVFREYYHLPCNAIQLSNNINKWGGNINYLLTYFPLAQMKRDITVIKGS